MSDSDIASHPPSDLFGQPAIIATVDGRESTARIEIRELAFSERLRMASKRLLIFWAIGAVCILVPMLHFVLVPAFFIIGIVAAVLAINMHKRIQSLKGLCPVCHQEILFTELAYKAPLKENCPHCRYGLRIRFES